MAEPAITPGEPIELTAEEFERYVAECVQQELGMSLEAFLAALDAGELPDTSAAMGLALLVRDARR